MFAFLFGCVLGGLLVCFFFGATLGTFIGVLSLEKKDSEAKTETLEKHKEHSEETAEETSEDDFGSPMKRIFNEKENKQN